MQFDKHDQGRSQRKISVFISGGFPVILELILCIFGFNHVDGFIWGVQPGTPSKYTHEYVWFMQLTRLHLTLFNLCR